ncbi:hypothetical protein ACFC1R_35215 [Kitasatospora sp. NPDC056138]|uniref:hypothetical protein n=1 Tax=Kitasatospora sp. NPDC056138 TaxID=3345724 RepID=UPI0035E15244
MTPWIAVVLRFGAATAVLVVAAEAARWAAIRCWSTASTRVERRSWIDRPIKSARKLGADIRIPGWRERMPRSPLAVPVGNPARLVHIIRARRLTRSVPAGGFARMAARRNSVDVLSEYPMRIIRAVANRVTVLAAAALVTYGHDHPGSLPADLRRLGGLLSEAAEQKTWVPVLVIAAGVFAAPRSSPVIDRVRARDEAAKDANRMLTELLARLSELQIALSLCHERLPSCRPSYFDRLCRTDQTGLTWSPLDGFRQDLHRGFPVVEPLEKELLGPEFQRAREALEAAHDHLGAIRDKGLAPVVFRMLAPVVFRMLAPVSSALHDCGFDRHLRFPVFSAPATDDSPLSFDWLVRRAENMERQVSRVSTRQGACRADAMLTEESYRLDDLILASRLNELRLQRIRTFLRKRIHGTTLTRLLGSVAK